VGSGSLGGLRASAEGGSVHGRGVRGRVASVGMTRPISPEMDRELDESRDDDACGRCTTGRGSDLASRTGMIGALASTGGGSGGLTRAARAA
jgi:hypothetical protein